MTLHLRFTPAFAPASQERNAGPDARSLVMDGDDVQRRSIDPLTRAHRVPYPIATEQYLNCSQIVPRHRQKD